jgi:site-specific recombinase XerD
VDFQLAGQIKFPDRTRSGRAGFGRVVAYPEVLNVTGPCLLESKGGNMLEDYVSAKITRRRLCTGPAANHVDEFSDWLYARGYKKRSLFRMLQSFAGWTDWLSKNGKTAEDFAEGLQECTIHFKSAPHIPYKRGPRGESLTVARLFLRFLGERGLLPQITGANSLAWSAPLLQEFDEWMLEQRGVTRVTLDVYRRVLEEFIATVGSDPHAYSPQLLREFVLTRGERHGLSYAKLGATAVRSYLRFLGATGRCKSGLEYALPAYASRKLSSIPKYLASEDVNRVIASCSTDGTGLRDKAIIMLLARLGLRAGDVVKLRLTDVDWTSGTIKVCGKGRRHDLLPLSQEVGTAVLRYLQKSRPASRAPEMFVTVQPPFRRLSYQRVGGIVRGALERAGVSSHARGAHVLRHSAATTMLRQGVSLASIGAVLRHRSPQTTARYAKVDIGMLSTIAQPWPGVASC